MAGRSMGTREVIDPNVTAVDVRATRAQFAPQVARIARQDLASPEDMRIVLQAIIDQQNQMMQDLSTLPFLGGVLIANQFLDVGGTVIRHGIAGPVDMMVTIPNAVSLVYIVDEDVDTRTIEIAASADCTVSLLIFPKKRGA